MASVQFIPWKLNEYASDVCLPYITRGWYYDFPSDVSPFRLIVSLLSTSVINTLEAEKKKADKIEGNK